jgi:hypothetical protein
MYVVSVVNGCGEETGRRDEIKAFSGFFAVF